MFATSLEVKSSNFNFPYERTELGDPCSTGLSALIFYLPVLVYENYFDYGTTRIW